MESELEEIKKSLSELHSKVSEINNKTSSKWMFPIVMLVLTSLASFANYFFEKNNDLDFIRKEIYAEFEAKEKIDFYKSVKNEVEDLSDSFEGYCLYKDSFSDSILSKELREFYLLYNSELIDDISLIDKMKNYSIYVSEASVDIQSGEVIDTKLIFRKSNKLKKEVLIGIDSGLKTLK